MRELEIPLAELVEDIVNGKLSVYPSIYPSNPIAILREDQGIYSFKVLIFARSGARMELKRILGLVPREIDGYTITNIAPGCKEGEILCYCSKGEILHCQIYENKIIDIRLLFTIPRFVDLFQESRVFLGLYCTEDLAGILVSIDFPELRDKLEEYWLFIHHGNEIIEYPFDALKFNIFTNEKRNTLSLIFADSRSLALIRYQPDKFTSIDETVFEIPFGAENESEIKSSLASLSTDMIGLSINQHIISLWTPAMQYQYSPELMYFVRKQRHDEYDRMFLAYNSRYSISYGAGRLYQIDFATGKRSELVILSPDYKNEKIQVEEEVECVSFVDGLNFLIFDDFNRNFLFQFKEKDNMPVFISRHYEQVKNFHELLEGCHEEVRRLYDSMMGSFKQQIKKQEAEMEAIVEEYTPRNYFTPEIDADILENLYRSKGISDLAEKYDINPMSIITHIRNAFGLPRCADHQNYTQACPQCAAQLEEWREKGRSIIPSIRYRHNREEARHQVSHLGIPSTHQSIRSIRYGINILCSLKDSLNLSDENLKEAMQILANAGKQDLFRGRSIQAFVIASLYIVSRNGGAICDIELLCDKLEVKKKNISGVIKTILKNCREVRIVPAVPELYLGNIVVKLALPKSVEDDARRILQTARENSAPFTGKNPKGIAGAAVYIAALKTGNRRTQLEIVTIAKITEVTLRKMANMLGKFGMKEP